MTYTKIAKPTNNSFLEQETGYYLLLETGGKIIINRGGYTRVSEPDVDWSKTAKPLIP